MTAVVLSECRFCGDKLDPVFDFGWTPLANALCATREEALEAKKYPLLLLRCVRCSLLQLSVAVSGEELFSNYTYATPDMESLSRHYGHAHAFIAESPDAVLEIGSNNGAFLRTFDAHLKVGVDPAENIASKADYGAGENQTYVAFFNERLGSVIRSNWGLFSLVAARHCLAHIHDVVDVIMGVRNVLADRGLFYIENAYAIDTMLGGQFDQVYHEHMSYLTLNATDTLLRKYGMCLIDADTSPIHGGSIMMLAAFERSRLVEKRELRNMMRSERAWLELGLVQEFSYKIKKNIDELARLFEWLKTNDRTVDCYGATAKTTTLLSAIETKKPVRRIRQCLDRAPLKIGKFLPGVGIPIVAEETWESTGYPDFCLLTAWNYADEIIRRERKRGYTGKWIIPFPEVRVVDGQSR